MKKLLLALLAAAPIALADDCATSECADAKGCATEIKTARKDLSSWRSDYKKLSRIERDSLKAARADLLAKDHRMKALAPTFGAQADMLSALAAMEQMSSKEKSSNAKVAAEMAATYRAMARTLAGKKSYPEPSLKSAEEIKAALKKAEADALKAKKMWMDAAKAKVGADDAKAIADAQKLMKQASPRMRALAKNATVVAKGYGALSMSKETADGDPRPALMKTSKDLHDMAAPYFKGVNLEKPKPMKPAPST